jgi:hypothetical protein
MIQKSGICRGLIIFVLIFTGCEELNPQSGTEKLKPSSVLVRKTPRLTMVEKSAAGYVYDQRLSPDEAGLVYASLLKHDVDSDASPSIYCLSPEGHLLFIVAYAKHDKQSDHGARVWLFLWERRKLTLLGRSGEPGRTRTADTKIFRHQAMTKP